MQIMPVCHQNVMFEQNWNLSMVFPTGCEAKRPTLSGHGHTHTSVGSNKIQCPICLRFSPAKEFGRCVGAPTAEYPKVQGPLSGSRKRKRTEMRTAHETVLAPCNECLDGIGEDDGRSWGRCDNPKCWSRRGEGLGFSFSNGSGGISAGMDDDDLSSAFANLQAAFSAGCGAGVGISPGLGLVCPSCSPEGGLGCAHKWICDICAFWSKNPLVWECPGCHNDFCDECEEVEERCVECGRADLCNSCRSAHAQEGGGRRSSVFTWSCRLCSMPVCKSCVGLATTNERIDSCQNCGSQLCAGCRSVLVCQGCTGEMCQLCPAESLVMLCERCDHI